MYIRILRRPVPDGQGQLAPGARRRRQVLYALAQLPRRRRDGAAAGIPAGEYTFSADGAQGAFSILPDGSNVTNKSDQSSSAVKSGKLTVAYEGSACIIAADITDSEGNNVKGNFRGSVAATDYAAYPAIGQIVSAQVSFYGGGNWFINLYDYPLEGSSSYRLTFDLYVSTETSPSAAGGLPKELMMWSRQDWASAATRTPRWNSPASSYAP